MNVVIIGSQRHSINMLINMKHLNISHFVALYLQSDGVFSPAAYVENSREEER